MICLRTNHKHIDNLIIICSSSSSTFVSPDHSSVMHAHNPDGFIQNAQKILRFPQVFRRILLMLTNVGLRMVTTDWAAWYLSLVDRENGQYVDRGCRSLWTADCGSETTQVYGLAHTLRWVFCRVSKFSHCCLRSDFLTDSYARGFGRTSCRRSLTAIWSFAMAPACGKTKINLAHLPIPVKISISCQKMGWKGLAAAGWS
jgi:hypothetical protein